MKNLPFQAWLAHENRNAHALLDIEDIFVLAAVRGFFFFLGVPMEVEDVNPVKGLHQALAHAAKGRVIQKGMVGDDANHAFFHLVHLPLGKAYELDVIVLEPFGIFFAQGLAVNLLVRVYQAGNPFALVQRMAFIGRIAGDYQNRFILDILRQFHLFGERRKKKVELGFNGLQGVGQVDLQALLGLHVEAFIKEILGQL